LSSSRSQMLSTCVLGITRVWPGDAGLTFRTATDAESFMTTCEWLKSCSKSQKMHG